jgi:hypothetical protein
MPCEFTALRRIGGTPPHWQATVGDKVLVVPTKHLANRQRFLRACLEAGLAPNLPPRAEWERHINKLLGN